MYVNVWKLFTVWTSINLIINIYTFDNFCENKTTTTVERYSNVFASYCSPSTIVAVNCIAKPSSSEV